MYGLRHSRLTRKRDGGSGGSNQTGCSPGESKRVGASNSKRRVATNTRKSERRSVDDTAGSTKRSSTAAAGSTEKGSTAAAGSARRGRIAAVGSDEADSVVAATTTGSAGRGRIAAVGSDETGSVAAATGRGRPAAIGSDVNTKRSNVDVNTEKRANVANANVDNTETRSANADGNSDRRISAAGVHSERTSAVRGDDDACGSISAVSGGVNSSLNIGSKWGSQAIAKRGRAKMARTELVMPPRSGRVELRPHGHNQFEYVGYNPKGYKYPSQVGVILKHEYPGIIKVYEDDGTVVKRQPALSWNDYYWKKDAHGIYFAKKVKVEF